MIKQIDVRPETALAIFARLWKVCLDEAETEEGRTEGKKLAP